MGRRQRRRLARPGRGRQHRAERGPPRRARAAPQDPRAVETGTTRTRASVFDGKRHVEHGGQARLAPGARCGKTQPVEWRGQRETERRERQPGRAAADPPKATARPAPLRSGCCHRGDSATAAAPLRRRASRAAVGARAGVIIAVVAAAVAAPSSLCPVKPLACTSRLRKISAEACATCSVSPLSFSL